MKSVALLTRNWISQGSLSLTKQDRRHPNHKEVNNKRR